jgi:hypothetical protein
MPFVGSIGEFAIKLDTRPCRSPRAPRALRATDAGVNRLHKRWQIIKAAVRHRDFRKSLGDRSLGKARRFSKQYHLSSTDISTIIT